MKLKSITVKDFQSIKDLTMDFNENGVYRFKGLNNTGKSAFLKSLSVLMRNVSNNNYKNYLRDGKDTFQISMEDFDGNKVKLSRGAIDFYEWEIEGERGRLDKTGGKVPIVLQNYFNLYIEKEKTNACLNIRLSREILLFIDSSGGDNSMMFQKALGTEDYMLGIKRVDKRGRELKKEVKILEKYKDKEEDKLEITKTEYQELSTKVTEIERFENTLRKDYEEYLKIQDLVQETENYALMQKELKDKKSILRDMEFDDIKESLEILVKISELTDLMEEEEDVRNNLTEKKERYKEVDLKELKKDIKILEGIDDSLGLGNKMVRHRRVIKQKKERLEEVKQELEDFKNELGVCPFCGGSLEEKHLH